MNEVNPKVFCPNFGVYFMRKKHDYSALATNLRKQAQAGNGIAKAYSTA